MPQVLHAPLVWCTAIRVRWRTSAIPVLCASRGKRESWIEMDRRALAQGKKSWSAKEKAKRDKGMQQSAKNFVEEEKR